MSLTQNSMWYLFHVKCVFFFSFFKILFPFLKKQFKKCAGPAWHMDWNDPTRNLAVPVGHAGLRPCEHGRAREISRVGMTQPGHGWAGLAILPARPILHP